MTIQELLTLLLKVLMTPEVIIVTVVIALYVNIVSWIVRYRKRPAGMNPRSRAAPPPAADKEGEPPEEDAEE